MDSTFLRIWAVPRMADLCRLYFSTTPVAHMMIGTTYCLIPLSLTFYLEIYIFGHLLSGLLLDVVVTG